MDVLATAASAIPAETNVAKVPNPLDGQVSLALWPGQDPNLHRLGIYEFEIEATPLYQAMRAAVLPRRQSPSLTIELSTSKLKIISATKDESFIISSSLPLRLHTEIGSAPMRFELNRRIMRSIRVMKGPLMKGPLPFTFNRHSGSLRWIYCNYITGEVEFDLCTGARWVPLAAPEDGPRTLAVLDPQSLVTGIRYASPLSGRKSPPNNPWEGLQIEGGSIFGAYHSGVSRYRSSSLPETLTLNVPKDHVANALALFGRLDGQVEVLETDSHVYIRAQNIEGSWTRMRSWSPSHVLAVNRLFESPPLRTVLIETPLLQRATFLLTVLFEKIQVTVEDRGTDACVVMSGLSKTEVGKTYLAGKLVCTGADNQRPWDLAINVKDLRDAASATTTPRTLLSICDGGLLIQSEGSEDKFETFLLGSERQ
ncbi:MAG: hypothetical protein ACLP4V_32950 [Methylocella sp.]